MATTNGVEEKGLAKETLDEIVWRRLAAHLNEIRARFLNQYPRDEDLARAIRVSKSHLGRLLSAEKPMSLQVLLNVCRAFKADVKMLLEWDPVPAEKWYAAVIKASLEDRRSKSGGKKKPRMKSVPSIASTSPQPPTQTHQRAQQKRRHPRVPVSLRASGLFGETFEVLDMSLGGLGVRTPMPLPRGHRLKLAVDGSLPSSYVVAWSGGDRAGLALIPN